VNFLIGIIAQRIVGGLGSTLLAIPLALIGASAASPTLASSLEQTFSVIGWQQDTATAVATIISSVVLLLSKSDLFGSRHGDGGSSREGS